MRKYRKVLKDQLEDIVCDVCGRSCLSDCSRAMGGGTAVEYATLEAAWGYCSKKDGDRYSCEICEECFDRVRAFIDSIRP